MIDIKICIKFSMSTEAPANELILLFFAEEKSEGLKTRWNTLEEAENLNVESNTF